MAELSKNDALSLLNEMKRECERRLAKAYDSYCLFPNSDDQRDWDDYSARDSALKIAVSALEKQIPVKPEFVEDYSSYRLYCPKCHHYFGTKGKHSVILFDMPKYCDCGQAIDWEVDG